jgi:hypothetical protein
MTPDRFLVGMERLAARVNVLGADVVDLTVRGPSLQVGGGVDIDVTDRVAVRLLGDWRRTRLGGEPAGAVLGGTLLSDVDIGPGGDVALPAFTLDTRRFAIGVVYRFGRR